MFWTWFFSWWLPEFNDGRARSRARLDAARADLAEAEAHLADARAATNHHPKGPR